MKNILIIKQKNLGEKVIEHSYEEIANEFDLTRTRIIQIEQKALLRMKKTSLSNKLKEIYTQ